MVIEDGGGGQKSKFIVDGDKERAPFVFSLKDLGGLVDLYSRIQMLAR